jgi:hypothetical protein
VKQDVYDLAEVMAWWDKAQDAARHFRGVNRYARAKILPSKSLSVHDKAHVYELIELLEYGLKILSERRVSLFERQRRCVKLCAFVHAALAIYDEDITALRKFSNFVVSDAEQWPALSKALVESHLRGWKDWRQANDPPAWVASVTRNISETERKDDQPNAETLPLEEIAEKPNEAVLVPRFTERSVSELIEAASHDPELREYTFLRARGWKTEAIRRKLGWSPEKAATVSKRFRRLRNRLRDQGAGIQCRIATPHPAMSDASCTVFFEPLFDGTHGAETGIWQHKSTQHAENEEEINSTSI